MARIRLTVVEPGTLVYMPKGANNPQWKVVGYHQWPSGLAYGLRRIDNGPGPFRTVRRSAFRVPNRKRKRGARP